MMAVIASVSDPTVPTSTPVTDPSEGMVDGLGDVLSGIAENLGDNGYQTGIALVVATIAVVAMLNLRVPRWIIAPVAVGAFWAGWLGWNTLTAQNNPLFPGDADATKLWDVALAGDQGFLIVVGVACVAAIFVWRTSMALAGRLMLMLGAVLGASFLYNLFESVNTA